MNQDQQSVRQCGFSSNRGAAFRMPDQGLYSFNNEHDACGVGMVADLNGTPAHRIVEMGVKVLERLMHRGAAGSDPETGDGSYRSPLPDRNSNHSDSARIKHNPEVTI